MYMSFDIQIIDEMTMDNLKNRAAFISHKARVGNNIIIHFFYLCIMFPIA